MPTPFRRIETIRYSISAAHSSLARPGVTTIEMIAALGLLGTAMLTTQAFYNRIVDGRTLLMQTNLVQRTLNNARAEIATWPADQWTSERIGQLPLTMASGHASEAQWLVEVKELTEPLPCKQIALAIQWQGRGQVHTSPSLTFWLATPAEPSDAR